MKNILLFKKVNAFMFWCFTFLLLSFSGKGYAQTPVPMSSQGGLTYTENFSDIANWGANFASGTGANRWKSYPITAGGSANDGKRTTKSSAVFSTSSGGGVQKGTGNLVFLSTGNNATSEAVAVDFLLDFTGVNAGTLSFDWATIDNSSGTRPTSLRIYCSTDNITFTEISAAQVIDKLSPATGTITTVALPSNFNGSATARIRFYNHAGTVTGSGSRDKIAIDNVTVTATASYAILGGTISGTAFTTTYGTESAFQTFPVSGSSLSSPLVATAATGFEVSRNDVVSYGATASYSPIEANAGGISFRVRLKNNANAGNYNSQNAVVLSSSPATSANIVTSGSGNTVSPLGLTITGVSAQDKTFDGNDTATLTGTATLNGVLFSDDAFLGGTPEAHFSSAAVGTWPVIVTGYMIGGTKSANYTVSQPTVADATIDPSGLASQTITFPALSDVVYGTPSVSLLATSDNPGGNSITYESSDINVATISGSTATIVGAGFVTITASQDGDVTHNPAIDQPQTFTVTPLGITVTGISALDKPYDGTTIATLTGTAVLTPAPINSDIVILDGTPIANFDTIDAGTQPVTVTDYTIIGDQAANYLLSQPVIADATITPVGQTITFFSSIPSLTTLTAPITLNAGASSGLAVTFESSDTNVATISGNILTIVGAGEVTISAKQAGDINHTAAEDVTQTRTVETVLYLNQFTGTGSCPTQGNIPTVAANLTGGMATRTTVTCTTLNNFFGSNNLNATSSINNNSYVEFTATADAGYRLNLEKMSFSRSGSGTAPNQLEVRYSTDGFATSTSMNNTVLTTTTVTLLTWDFADFTTPISGTVTFRIYPYGTQRSDLNSGAAASSGTFRIDDPTIYGTVVIPPPSVTTTTPPTAITTTSATLGGDVTSTGGSAILGNGVVISETSVNADPTVGGTDIPNGGFSDGTGTFSVPSGTLTSNNQYSYAAYATNSQGTSYGDVASFYTLAEIPENAPQLSDATLTTIGINLGSANDPNNYNTSFVIRVISGANTYYLQSDYTLGLNPVWQNGFTWISNAVVVGLTSNTSYTFDVKARNGDNVETDFGTSASLSTLENLEPNLVLTSAAPDFGNVCTTGANNFAITSFTFNGAYLNSTDLSVASSATELTFSTAENGTYSNPLNITNASATITGQVVWVKLSPTVIGAFSGTIAITGGGLASSFDVNATGTGINTPATVTTGAVSDITVVGATIDGTAVAGCSVITDSGIEYSLDDMFAGATQVSGLPTTLTTLSPNTLYYVRAYATDSSLEGIAYGSSTTFTTLGLTTGPVALDASLVDGNSFVANWEPVAGAESYQLDVSTNPSFSGDLTTIADWNFPNATDDAIIDAGIAANNGKTLTTVGGVGSISYSSVASSTTSAASGSGWASGNGSKYWQIDISTVGYSSLELSSAQRSSNSGPRDFIVEYSVDGGGVWTPVPGSTVVVSNNWTTGVLSDIALPTACDNQASVLLRWIMTTNNAASSGTVAAGGTSGIDSIIITGRPPSFSIYENLSVNGLSQLVSGGLTELTDYYYRVRAYSANSTSENSNVIQVTTTAAPPTFDSVSYSGATVCDGTNGTFDVNGLTPNVASRIYYDINGDTTQNVLTTVADVSGAATFEIPLPISANFQLLTITLVERADATSSLVVDSNNIVFITGIAENITYYEDADADTFGNPAVSQVSCEGAPSGYVIDNTDCDDTNIAIYQFATFYVDADGDTYGSNATASVCSGLTVPAGYSSTNDDCDDTDALLNPTNPCVTPGSVVNLTMFIQGYYAGGSTMSSVKLNQWDGVTAEPSDLDVEDMVVELHDAVTYELVDTAIGTLHTDGTLSVTFNTAAAGSYYIAVKGSNLVQTWSAEPQTIGTTPLAYDFSTSASQAYGDNMTEIETGVFAMYQGDLSPDDLVDLTDFSDWEAKYLDFAFGVEPSDLNGDGLVDLSDFSIWETNYLNFVYAAYPF